MPGQNLKEMQHQLARKKADLAQRFEEVARLTELLEEEQSVVDQLQKQIETLQQNTETTAEPLRLHITGEQRERNRAHIEQIRNSDLFDAEWYLKTYPDVARSAEFLENPAAHYALFGGFEGRKPCPDFDSAFYLLNNQDVAKAGINPLAHYLNFGRSEGRSCTAPVENE